MTTTTIRLPDDLKAKIAKVAERAGTTTHNFILEAIAEKADAVERRDQFIAVAEARLVAMLKSRQSVSWENVDAHITRYAERSTQGKSKPKRPQTRPFDAD